MRTAPEGLLELALQLGEVLCVAPVLMGHLVGRRENKSNCKGRHRDPKADPSPRTEDTVEIKQRVDGED